MKGVSIVIPVYGQWPLVKLNIEKNMQYDGEQIHEVIIVDDCSPEINPYLFNDKVRIIRNEKNRRYTSSVNVGLRAATADIVILLDSDAYPTNSYVPRLVSIYENSSVGCVGFKTVDDKGNDTGNFDFEPSLIGFIAGQQLHAKFKHLDFFSEKRILPFSCAVSFRKECLEEMNYFDEEKFPVLDADNDLSMRIHRSNWKLIFDTEIKIFHEGGNSIPRNHKRVLTYHQSRWRLLEKHGHIKWAWITKQLLSSRVRAEILMLSLMSWIRVTGTNIDKLQGRKILLKEIKNY